MSSSSKTLENILRFPVKRGTSPEDAAILKLKPRLPIKDGGRSFAVRAPPTKMAAACRLVTLDVTGTCLSVSGSVASHYVREKLIKYSDLLVCNRLNMF